MIFNNQKKNIIKNFTKKDFFISDGKKTFNGILIKQILKEKLDYLSKFKLTGNTIAILENKCGAIYWINLIVAYISNYTIYPQTKISDIQKYYKNIVIFRGEKIYVKIKNIKKNKHLEKFNIIFSSSGTTGETKLILQSMNSLINNANHVLKNIKFKKNKIFMMCIPYLYTSAICHFFACLMSNVKIYAFEDTLLPSDLKKNILKKKVNYFGGPPLHSKWIVDFIKNKNYNFEKLISSGDFLDNLTIDKYLYKRFKFSFFYMYGISEVGGRLCINLIKNNKYKYSVGKPLNYMKFAKNASSQSEILVKSDFLYYGYYTKKRFLVQKGKIYHTGDMGSIKEGNLILSGRTSEIFKSGGIMVYPQLIYNELIKTKWFKEVFIFKGYDKSFGNIPICVFSSSNNISIKKILEYLKKKVSKEQIPRKIYRVKEFPRLGNKKIDKLSIINTFNQ